MLNLHWPIYVYIVKCQVFFYLSQFISNCERYQVKLSEMNLRQPVYEYINRIVSGSYYEASIKTYYADPLQYMKVECQEYSYVQLK